MRLKSRICTHGNRDRMKDDIRKDSSTAQFNVIRMTLSKATDMDDVLGHVEIRGAYIQSGPIQRTIYVRPPRKWEAQEEILWRLTKLPYGIKEAGVGVCESRKVSRLKYKLEIAIMVCTQTVKVYSLRCPVWIS